MHSVQYRHATAEDVEAILALFAPHSENGSLLKRDRDDVFQHLQEFIIAEEQETLIACAALHIYGSNLAEIRSLVVHPQAQGRGIAKKLIEVCEQQAKQLAIAKIFALTYVAPLFESLDYQQIAKETLPQKIWTVCIHCQRFSHCNEIAVCKHLSQEAIKPMQMEPLLLYQYDDEQQMPHLLHDASDTTTNQ